MNKLFMAIMMIASMQGYSGTILPDGAVSSESNELTCYSVVSSDVGSMRDNILVTIKPELGRQVAEIYSIRGDFMTLIKHIGVARRAMLSKDIEAIYLYRDGIPFKLTLYRDLYDFDGHGAQYAYLSADINGRRLIADLECYQD